MWATGTGLWFVTPWVADGVDIREVMEVSGRKFIKVTKSNPRIERLLTGKAAGQHRQLTRTTIVETLTALRNAKREEFVAMDTSGHAKEDLGLYEETEQTVKRSKVSAALVPQYSDIVAPQVGIVAGLPMAVLLSQPHTALWVEATQENVEYLFNVVSEQLKAPIGDRTDGMMVCNSGLPKGVVWCPSRQAYRYRYMEGNQKKTKDFQVKDSDSKDEIIAAIREFASTLQ